MQVDFNATVFDINGVATQGRDNPNYNQWVTGYTLSYSMDNNMFIAYIEDGIVKVSDVLFPA